MVYRIFVEKKPGYANEAQTLLEDARRLMGIGTLRQVRLINRYDVENIPRDVFESAVRTVFAEPQVDTFSEKADLGDAQVFAVEFLPGQFDQRADSAAQCIQILTGGEKPIVRSAKLYALYGDLTKEQIERLKQYVINPVEAREASLAMPSTLREEYPVPEPVRTLDGFRELDRDKAGEMISRLGLAMDRDDLMFCRDYFRSEDRDPTMTELRMIDTYWSDHCRHTTFLTVIDHVSFIDPEIGKAYQHYLQVRRELGREDKPVTLMDIATIAAKYLKKNGMLDKLDESEEINACTVRIEVERDGIREPWLLLFKNETHNHPTEIEPFGGAATCIGGAIRDPLSGRAYVYGAMRITGAADPTEPLANTIPGKLPQRKLVTTAAAGYSSYGNQIGLATGIVKEIYHPGYAAKRMEIGAVIGAVPASEVRRETPVPGDIVILLGGATGRDGIGGATGSSKAHDTRSVENCGAEVQKGNAPEERKLQRLFRDPAASRMIKRCNDFGAGGVSVAIGELAEGLEIDLDRVPKKYEGLDGTELAISESQERMAVVVSASDVKAFEALADRENLSAVPVAEVKAEPRLTMKWRGDVIVDLSRRFLDSNGAEKHISIEACTPREKKEQAFTGFRDMFLRLASDLNCCSGRGLAERFDSTIGAGTVLMPFGGKKQLTPTQAMVQKISLEHGETNDCSLMSYGFDPYLSEESPFRGAYCAVVSSVSKLVAAGASFEDVYLTFQEYFAKPKKDPARWGMPFSALLGAFEAQMRLGVAAIGGKDSMSGTFEDLDVPPTLVSFAVTTARADEIISPEFKQPGDRVVLLRCRIGEDGLPDANDLKEKLRLITSCIREGIVKACYVPDSGGIAEAVLKMSLGNGFGFRFEPGIDIPMLFGKITGAFVLEVTGAIPGALTLGTVTAEPGYFCGSEHADADEILRAYEDRLEDVFPCNIGPAPGRVETVSFCGPSTSAPSAAVNRPRVLIPVFPGTNCEYDSARAVERTGCEARIFVINNLTGEGVLRSMDLFCKELRDAQILFLPGGFSGGDEPDGSAKFITAFLRNEAVKDQVSHLLDTRGGLICGICNGFQALVKLGLLPFGRIVEPQEDSPTLTYNRIGRHQSRIVRTRIASDLSPWLRLMRVGDIVNVPVSHGEGRFVASDEQIRDLIAHGQIATQYVDEEGSAGMDIRINPNGSVCAIEGITSPDGRIIGKMGHSERIAPGLYRNVPGCYDNRMFEAARLYFKG